jgi:membrane-associated PAP2 superfamily phosphatase
VNSAARISHGSLLSDAPNAWAVPWKLAWTVAGRPICRSAAWIAVTACPSATPGARLNDSVVAGSCPWWLIDSGVGEIPKVAMLESGTSVPFDARR